MFIENKYTTWYNNIIANALKRINYNGYTERHHIIPKSLKGTNDKSNLVSLTPKEHFVCHRLLTKMTVGESRSKMIRAFWMIATMGNKDQKRIKVHSRKYCQIKNEWLQHGNLNKPKTEEHKANMRKPKSEEHKKALSIAASNSVRPKHREDTKKKMSEWQKGVPKERKICDHCKKSFSFLNHKRWHGENCKFIQRSRDNL